MGKQNVYTVKEAYQKLARYCVYQERCHQEIEQKLKNYQLSYTERQEVIAHLIADNFLNEERFAIAFTRDKFHLQKWGKQRIKRELKQRRISDYLIQKALREIREKEYHETFDHLVNKKLKLLAGQSLLQKKKKLLGYLARKGYEYDLIYAALNRLPQEQKKSI